MLCDVHSKCMATAKQIRSARAKLGESQTAFAARFRVDQSTIARWETYGPPERGPAAVVVEHLLNNLNSQSGNFTTETEAS